MRNVNDNYTEIRCEVDEDGVIHVPSFTINAQSVSQNFTLCRTAEELSREELHSICMQSPLYRDAYERRN